MSFINWEPKDKMNANNSRYLGFAQIALFILGVFFPLILNYGKGYNFVFLIAELLLGVGTYYTAIKIGFQNTYATNDPYKTIEQIISAILNLFVPLLYIVSLKSIIQ